MKRMTKNIFEKCILDLFLEDNLASLHFEDISAELFEFLCLEYIESNS